MPISEDEFENRVHSSNPLAYHQFHQQQLQIAMSKAEQRKNNKPIMEKKRRARINNCLNELKTLILDAMKKDPARHSKLEKADILEMTVKHLQSVQKQQLSVAMAADPGVVHKFKTGFSECATEVNRFIGRLEGIDAGLKQRLMNHLGNCVSGLQQITPFSYAQTPAAHSLLSGGISLDDLNNNRNGDELQRLQAISGIQLIPSRLPTGEFAFVLPNSASSGVKSNQSLDSPNLISEIMNRTHASAFTAVHHKDDGDEKTSLLSPSSVSSSSPVSFIESSTSSALCNNNDEVTSTSNLEQFKIPQRNFNKSLMKNKVVYQTHSPQVKPEEPLLKEVSFPTPVSIKVEDTLRHYEDSKHDIFTKSFLTSQKLIKPLTVITSNEEKDACGKNPLDFSMKKGLGLVQPVDSSQKSPYEPLIKIERSESVGRKCVPEIDSFSQRLIQAPEIQVRVVQDGLGHKTVPSIIILPKDLSQSRGDDLAFSKNHGRGLVDGDRTEPPSKRHKLDSSEEDGDSPRPKSESSPLSSSTLSTSTLSTSSGSSSAEKDSMWRPW